MEPPPEAGEPPNVVYRCKKAMYGLRKSPQWFQDWQVKLLVQERGFTQNP